MKGDNKIFLETVKILAKENNYPKSEIKRLLGHDNLDEIFYDEKSDSIIIKPKTK